MKKLNVILHDTTIINFPFFWKLILRYKWISFLIPTFIFSLSILFYNSQNDIFLQRIYFKNRTNNGEGPKDAISSVLGEKTNSLTESEILGMMASLDFQQDLTETVFNHENLNTLNLGHLSNKKIFNMEEFLSLCSGQKKCIFSMLRARLLTYFKIMPDPSVLDKYYLEIRTRDPKTSTFLLSVASQKIMENRVHSIRQKIEEQIKITEELSQEKRNEIESVNLLKLKEDEVKVKAMISDLNKKITSYEQYYQRLKLDLVTAETQVDETKKVSEKDIETDKLFLVQKRRRLATEIKKLKKDIDAIKSVSNLKLLSSQDKTILSQLKVELKKTQAELKKMGNKGRETASVASLIKKKEGERSFTEFDFRVIKKRFKKSKADLDEMIEKRSEKVNELANITNKIEKFKPSFEYLRRLEEKNIQLSLLNSTVVSDLIFEREFSSMTKYKKINKAKMILFSLASSLLVVGLLIFILYLIDDRIYDLEELEKSFDELTVIGNTPDFD